MARKVKPLIDRLGEKLKAMPNGCWEFQGYRQPWGYGKISRGCGSEGTTSTHRAMWEIVFGSIPNGMCVLHKCDNPPCANPAHLFLGTNAINTTDMITKGRARTSGEANSMAKLTWEKVHNIRADTRPQNIIAAEYGVSKAAISDIKNNRRWKEKTCE